MPGLLVNAIINIVYAFASVTAVFAFIGFMIGYFSSPGPRIRYLSDASYWGYLMHLPLVGFFQILVAPYDFHWGFKLVFIFVPVLSLLFISYQYFVRNTLIGVLLNGAVKSNRPELSPLKIDSRSDQRGIV